ncbi:hypothetical protein A4X13_0g4066 [Tilletia indica]|uniref:Uncharacterized protein n=1 Tax=Tilletia indica TaxID=43049 RepID=A0A8T8SYG6_9BASI|nr:hypothetical protein A4X13_0g4066 [Tilletia indica]
MHGIVVLTVDPVPATNQFRMRFTTVDYMFTGLPASFPITLDGQRMEKIRRYTMRLLRWIGRQPQWFCRDDDMPYVLVPIKMEARDAAMFDFEEHIDMYEVARLVASDQSLGACNLGKCLSQRARHAHDPRPDPSSALCTTVQRGDFRGQRRSHPLHRGLDGSISITRFALRAHTAKKAGQGGDRTRAKSQGVKTKGKARETTAMISRCVKARTRQRQDGQRPAEGEGREDKARETSDPAHHPNATLLPLVFPTHSVVGPGGQMDGVDTKPGQAGTGPRPATNETIWSEFYHCLPSSATMLLLALVLAPVLLPRRVEREQEDAEKKENARLKEKDALLKEEDARLKEEDARLKEEDARLKEESARLKEESARLKKGSTRLKKGSTAAAKGKPKTSDAGLGGESSLGPEGTRGLTRQGEYELISLTFSFLLLQGLMGQDLSHYAKSRDYEYNHIAQSGASRRKTPRTRGRDGDSRGEFNFDILTFRASQVRCVNTRRTRETLRDGTSGRQDYHQRPHNESQGWYSGAQDDPDSRNGRWRLGAQDSLPSAGAARPRSAVLRIRLNGYLKAIRQCARAAQYNPDGDGQNRASKAPSPGLCRKTTVSKLKGVPDSVDNSVLPVPPCLEAPFVTYTIGTVRDPPPARFKLRGPTDEKE